MGYRMIAMCWACAWCVSYVLADTVTLSPVQDTTIYESDGTRSNGGGGVFFTGTSSAGSPRRGLLRFDIAGGIPAGSTIDHAMLTLHVASFAGSGGTGGSDPTPHLTTLHSLSSAWGEGTAGTGTGAQGSGAGFPTLDDGTSATWTHAYYAKQPWTPGGDFQAIPSASTLVTGTIGVAFTWSSPEVRSEVQAWLDHPSSNFGWIMVGNEATPQTFRSFHSRESANADFHPSLTVTYTPIPEPASNLCMIVFAMWTWFVTRRMNGRRNS